MGEGSADSGHKNAAASNRELACVPNPGAVSGPSCDCSLHLPSP